MKVKSFLKLVEIQTKLASMIPFTLGIIYSIHRFHRFNLKNSIIMFISLLTFDMATTAINNYLDYKNAKKKSGYGFEVHNAIVRDNLKPHSVLSVIVILLTIATGFGIALYLETNLIVLVIGCISFAVGILYTFGPVPISRMPLGEVFSGFFMGFIIVFLTVFINVDKTSLLAYEYNKGMLGLNINLYEVLILFLFTLPSVLGIANLMLANNICDIEDDIENKRYTLPIYIGREGSIKLFNFLYFLAFADIILLIVLKVMPLTVIPALLIFLPVRENVVRFNKKQSKKDTFPLSVKNFVLINASLIVSIAADLIIQYAK